MTPSRIEENLKVVKLDSSDLEDLANISKTKGLTRYVYPAFGVSGMIAIHSRYRNADGLKGQSRFPRQAVDFAISRRSILCGRMKKLLQAIIASSEEEYVLNVHNSASGMSCESLNIKTCVLYDCPN